MVLGDNTIMTIQWFPGHMTSARKNGRRDLLTDYRRGTLAYIGLETPATCAVMLDAAVVSW